MRSGLFENEIEPGVLWSSIQQTCPLPECERNKQRATDHVSILSLLCEIFADCILVEHWAEAHSYADPLKK